MTSDEYQKNALRTWTPEKFNTMEQLNCGALGLCGESGEFADHIKKAIFQGHKLDNDYMVKELGDILWYLAITADALGIKLSDIMQINIDKLKKRYPNGFEVERSVNR